MFQIWLANWTAHIRYDVTDLRRDSFPIFCYSFVPAYGLHNRVLKLRMSGPALPTFTLVCVHPSGMREGKNHPAKNVKRRLQHRLSRQQATTRMHAHTIFALVLACGLHRKQHAVLVQGVRVQNSARTEAQVQSNAATLLPNLSIFEKYGPQFVAELIRFDRMERGTLRRGYSSTCFTRATEEKRNRPGFIVSGRAFAYFVGNKGTLDVRQ